MDWRQLLSNQWVVAVVATLAGAALLPTIGAFVGFLRSRLGAFSGRYLCLSWNPDGTVVDVEEVRCSHRGANITGNIHGVVALEKDPKSTKYVLWGQNSREYRFSGNVHERMLVLSYRSRLRGTHSVGAMALNPDSAGQIFFGEWVGLIDKTVRSGKCLWVMLQGRDAPKSKSAEFCTKAKLLADEYVKAQVQETRAERTSERDRPPEAEPAEGPAELVEVKLPDGKTSKVSRDTLTQIGAELLMAMHREAMMRNVEGSSCKSMPEAPRGYL